MTAQRTATDGRVVQPWWGGAGSTPCYVQDSLGNTIRHGDRYVPGKLHGILDMLNSGRIDHVTHAGALIMELLDGKPLEGLKVQ